MKQPLVSVIVTCYNYGQFLKEAINSVTGQSYAKTEVIILDDGSTDNTNEVGLELQKLHENIQFIRQDNQGVIATRNNGIKKARGEFIVFLDADDRLEEGYLQDTVNIATRNGVDIVYTDYKMFGAHQEESNFPDFSLEELKNHNYIHISSLIRKKSIGSVIFDEKMKEMSHEDWDFFLAICMKGAKAEKCSTTHLEYRIHEVSRNNKLEDDAGRLKFAQVFLYVTGKYPQGYPNGAGYLSGRVFSDWYVNMSYKVGGIETDIRRMEEEKERFRMKSETANAQLDEIKKSKYYKLYIKLRSVKARLRN